MDRRYEQMADIADIKAAVKAAIDATGEFGSVYTEARERVENPNPAGVMMWHDSWSQVPCDLDGGFARTDVLILWVVMQRPALFGEAQMQVDMTGKAEAVNRAINSDPTLGGLARFAHISSCEFDYDRTEAGPRMLATMRLEVEHEV